MKIKNILFDLDGTLTDSFDGIAKSVTYALEKMGVGETPVRESLKRFLGPPMEISFKEFYKMDDETASRATQCFRQRYAVRGIFENTVYDGIIELLEYLKSSGRRSFVATSKPRPMAEIVLKHFDIEKYFEYVQAVEFGDTEPDKTRLLSKIIDKYSLNPEETVMVGDRYFDIDAANNLNVTSIGILHGAGSKDEFIEHNATVIVKDSFELKKFFENDEETKNA